MAKTKKAGPKAVKDTDQVEQEYIDLTPQQVAIVQQARAGVQMAQDKFQTILSTIFAGEGVDGNVEIVSMEGNRIIFARQPGEADGE